MSESDIHGTNAAARTTRGIVWLVLAASILAMLGILAFGAASIVGGVIDGSITTRLDTAQPLPTSADSGTATLVDGTFDGAFVTVTDVSTATMVVDTIASVAGLLTQLAVAGALALLCWSLLNTKPFRRRLSLTVTLAGGTVLIGGIISAGLAVFSSWLIAEQLNAASDGLDGFWPISASVDPTFIALGLGLMLVGLAFGHAENLQRDTAGLV